jgi:hypothetical protein
MPEHSWSPGGALPEATPARREEAGLGPSAPSEGTLDLGLVNAVIRDGLLMVFGPDGDPVPPQVFGAAAAEQPDAAVRLADGARGPAERIAAVLDAQTGGRLGTGQGGDEPWILAMLGIAPQPEMTESDDLQAERCTVEVVAFGRELMITSPHGATFLIADARLRTADSICVWVGSEGPVSPSDLVDRLLAGDGRERPEAAAHEFALPECHAWLEDDALMLDLPAVGPVYLARLDDAGVAAPAASMFMANGEVATIDHLLSALSGPATPPAFEHMDPPPPPPAAEQVDSLAPAPATKPADFLAPAAVTEPADPLPPPAAFEQEDSLAPAPATEPAGFPGPAAATEQADPPPPPPPLTPAAALRQPVPLSIGLPDAFAATPDRVVLIVVRGLPEGASLSAGVPGGDGVWLCSPRDLPDVSLTLPPAWASDLALEIAAIAVVSPEGELAKAANTVLVAAPSAADASALEPAPAVMVGPARVAIPLDLEAQVPSGAGPFDAWLVRDLPAGMTLSAGTYDPAIDVWVLLPHQLAGLCVLTSGARPEDFTLSLTGVSLQAGSGARPRVLVRVPVSLARQSRAR